MPHWSEFRQTKLYDFLTAAPMMLWFILSMAAMTPAFIGDLRNAETFHLTFIVSMLSRAAAIAFIFLLLFLLVIRRPAKARLKGPLPRITAAIGTYLLVAVVWLPPYPMGLLMSLSSLLLTLGGMCFSIFALAHLGRSFSVMPEARALVTDGPYALVRHPLYLGEAISALGLMLQYFSSLAVLIVAVQFLIQLQRMKNEEKILASLFPEYEGYSQTTMRVLPGLY